jgi:hypothetical protein
MLSIATATPVMKPRAISATDATIGVGPQGETDRDETRLALPYLQLVAALPLLERAADDAVAGTLRPQKVDLPSHLWSHPTLWQYVKTGLRRGVW